MLRMLDTNIVSHAVSQPNGPLELRMRQVVGELAISVVVAAELRFGAEKKRSSRLLSRIEQLTTILTVLPLPVDAADHYARIRDDLERRGTPIGNNDLLIAAHALALDATLVTDNVREFERVEGLRIENWLRD